jgi:hypothetical protein
MTNIILSMLNRMNGKSYICSSYPASRYSPISYIFILDWKVAYTQHFALLFYNSLMIALLSSYIIIHTYIS